MTEVSMNTIQEIRSFLESLKPEGGTRPFPPLQHAFRMAGARPLSYLCEEKQQGFDLDTIYLLSDGEPDPSPWLKDVPIQRLVLGLNSQAFISIHCIGIGEGAESSFLEELATQNSGVFKSLK